MTRNTSVKPRKIWLWILTFVLCVFALLFIWQWDNIKIIYQAVSTPSSELEKRTEYSHEQIDTILKNHGLNPMYDDETTADGEGTDGTGDKKTSQKASVIVQRYVSSMQSLKVKYEGKLNALMEQAKAEYIALPKSKKGKTGATTVASKYIGTAYSLQSSCDAEVNALLSELDTKLREIGADTSIVSAMRTAYENEKSAKISYYMDKMK